MSLVTIPVVRTWHPEELGTAAASLGEVSSRLDHEIAALRAAMDTASAQWTGPAAEAAGANVGTEVRAGRQVCDALATARAC